MTETNTVGLATAAMKKAFETGDRSDFVALLAPSATTWHNHDNIAAETKRTGTNPIPDMIDNPRLEITRAAAFPGGEFMQFTLHGTGKTNGKTVEAHMCIIFTISDEGVTRLDEYIDPTLTTQLAAEGA
ncbi:MAG: nuclear transport factor 2 family protein [Frankiales bacterium]|nr:nuclear transport factor 2 family protein [Frankiales bacterium]